LSSPPLGNIKFSETFAGLRFGHKLSEFHALAQNNLGFMYANGFGVSQDIIRAYIWWYIAASKGNEEAILGRNMIENQMTPKQMEKALDLAARCAANSYENC